MRFAGIRIGQGNIMRSIHQDANAPGLSGMFAGLFLAAAVHAQDPQLVEPSESDNIGVETPGIEQEILLSAPLSQFPGKWLTVIRAEFEPGTVSPLHRHAATTVFYVLEGNGVMENTAGTTEELSPGRVLLGEPAAGEDSFTHQATNLDDSGLLRTLVVVIHDEGVPPGLPVEE